MADNFTEVPVKGKKGNNTAVPGTTNVGTLPAVATNASPSFTEGNQVGLSVDLTGALRVASAAGSGDVNIDGINGVTPSVGNGVTGTGSLRVTIASDNTAFGVNIASALPAGNNNIGDVDIASAIPTGSNTIGSIANITTAIVPGTGATNLGKAIDAVAGATDTGVVSLAKRVDSPAAITPANGDWSSPQLSANGYLWVKNDSGTVAGAASLPAGTNNIGDVDVLTLPALPAGTNNIGDVDIASAIPAGSNLIGKVGIDQTTPGTTNGAAIVGINSATALAGNGVTGTGSLRVTIASDNTPFAIKLDQTTPGTTNAISLAQIGATTVATGNGTVGTGVQRVAIASDNSSIPVTVGNFPGTQPVSGTVTANQGTSAAVGAPWYVRLSDGAAAFGTAANPLSVLIQQSSGTLADSGVLTSASLAAGASATFNSSAMTTGTPRLLELTASASVRLKVVFQTYNGSTATDRRVFFVSENQSFIYAPRDEDTFTVAAGAGVTYRLVVTNMDNANAADVYASLTWST